MTRKHWSLRIGAVLHNAFVKLLENVLSKKFLIFTVSTTMLWTGHLPSEEWAMVTLAVLGAVSTIDYKRGQKSLDDKGEPISLLTPPEIP